LLVLVTDGRHTAGEDPKPIAVEFARRAIRSVVVDCERGPVKLGMAGRLAAGLGGELITLDDLRAESLAGMVRSRIAPITNVTSVIKGTEGTRAHGTPGRRIA
jgi:magnesium chelatase subunit D